MSDFKKLKVVELRAELSERGLDTTGKKDELIERLEEYEFEHAPVVNVEEDSEAPSAEPMDTDSNLVEILSAEPMDTDSNLAEPPSQLPSNLNTPLSTPELKAAEVSDFAAAQDHELIDEEERKRRARAIRFGLDPDSCAPPLSISVTITRLEKPLPDRKHYNRGHSHGKGHGHQGNGTAIQDAKVNKPTA